MKGLMQKKIGIIGLGNMGQAILQGLLSAKTLPPSHILGCEIDEKKREGVASSLGIKTYKESTPLLPHLEVILLAIKPQTMEELLKELKPHVTPSHLVISIAAGITTAYIEQRLQEGVRLIRAMPNTPALVQEGATALCSGQWAREEDKALAQEVFKTLGPEVVFVDESLMDVVTAISGSGPAYVFLLMESLIDAAQKEGLPLQMARQLVAQTVLGSARLLLRSEDESPASLREKVTSPGGTTEAALKVFFKSSFPQRVHEAVRAAILRAKELRK